jgi:ribonuclease P protein component
MLRSSAPQPEPSHADAARPRAGRFPRSARLLKHASFDQVYRNGQKHFSGNMTVFFLRRTPAPETATEVASRGMGPRVGFTVPRALGPAVNRNRIKRRMREAVRRNLERLQGPFDIVFNPKKTVLTAEFEKIEAEVARAFTVVQQKAKEADSSDAETKGPSTPGARDQEQARTRGSRSG